MVLGIDMARDAYLGEISLSWKVTTMPMMVLENLNAEHKANLCSLLSQNNVKVGHYFIAKVGAWLICME